MKSQISVLKNSLSGDFLDGKFDNGRYSTDASIYQIMPEAVILPKNIEDIKKTIQFAQEHNIPILPRGGGTSQNGQTVNRAIVLDNSKYLNKIIEVDVCPPHETLRKDMDSRQKNGEFLSWAAFCFPVEFKPLKDKEDREFQKEKIKEATSSKRYTDYIKKTKEYYDQKLKEIKNRFYFLCYN